MRNYADESLADNPSALLRQGRALRTRVASAFWFSGCDPRVLELQAPSQPKSKTGTALDALKGGRMGKPIGDKYPWIAHLEAVDLDEDSRMDILGCEFKDDEVIRLRQQEDGSFEEVNALLARFQQKHGRAPSF